MLTCEKPNLIQSIQMTYNCFAPIYSSESTVCLDTINGTEIIESQVFINGDLDIHDASIYILFTIIDYCGKIIVITKKYLLPLSLYCKPVEAVLENNVELTITTNFPRLNFEDMFCGMY